MGENVRQPQPLEPPHDAPLLGGYLAALIGTAVLVPLVAASCTVIFYLINDRGHAMLEAIASTLALWLAAGLVYRFFTLPNRANPTVYNELTESVAGLRLALQRSRAPITTEEKALRTDIDGRLTLLETWLGCTTGDVRWVAGTGYIHLWRMVHSVDEDLITLATPAMAREAIGYDLDRLSGSTVPGGQTMMNALEALQRPISAGDPPRDTAADLEAIVGIRKKINEFRDTNRAGLLETRNRIFVLGIITGLILDTLVGVSVSYGVSRSRVAAAATFFLAGAVIGIFRRLYDEFQSSSDIEDYSLSTARTIVTPMVSGIAGLFGVLFILIPGAFNGVLPTGPISTTNTPTATATLTPTSGATGTVGGTSTSTTTAATRTTTGATAALASTDTAVTGGTTATATASPTPAASPTPVPVNLPSRTATLGDLFDIERFPSVLMVAILFGFAPGLFVRKLQDQVKEYKSGLESSQASSRPDGVRTTPRNPSSR